MLGISRLRGGTSWALQKFQSIPPLVTLPALGLAAWFATPYAVNLATGRSAAVTTMAAAGETDGTTEAPRSDPVARQPATEPGTPSPVGTAGGANLLARPITASAIPSWLPVPAPVPAATPASQPAQPRATTAYAAPPAPRPAKATARLIEPLPQQRVAARQASWGGMDQRRSVPSLMESFNHSMRTGRSAATGSGLARGPVTGGFQPRTNAAGGYRAPVAQRQWTTGGGYRGPMVQSGFGGFRSFSGSNFGGMRGGGSFGGFRGGHR